MTAQYVDESFSLHSRSAVDVSPPEFCLLRLETSDATHRKEILKCFVAKVDTWRPRGYSFLGEPAT